MSFEVTVQRDPEDSYRNLLIAIHNGKEIINEIDNGESEDNTFTRDWAWVPDALREAYRLGYEDEFKKSGNNNITPSTPICDLMEGRR